MSQRRRLTEDEKSVGGRFYKLVRDQTPKLLGKRICPNCRSERSLDQFKRIRRGSGALAWICDWCFEQRKLARRK